MKKIIILVVVGLVLAVAAYGIVTRPSEAPPVNPPAGEEPPPTQTPPDRGNEIPDTAIKVTPSQDQYPPILQSGLYEEPFPLGSGVNTSGGEDSPFITPDGATLYFFFTPDVSVPAEKQLFDGVTGIWASTRLPNGTWGEAKRIRLQDAGKLALDGAEFVQGDTMLFASAREGYEGIGWYRADSVDGEWTNWRNVDDELKTEEYQTGELHVSPDGGTLYFHSPRPGGVGGLDIWASKRIGEEWGEPFNVAAVNTPDNEGWPALSPDGDELWFLRTYLGSPAIYVSRLVDGSWSTPELIVSQFAGEPSVDEEGNLYFVHHYYRNGTMMEADIYVARHMNVPLKPVDASVSPARGFLTACLPKHAKDQELADAYILASDSVDLIPVWGRPTPFYDMADDLRGGWGDIFVDDLIRGNGMTPIADLSFIGEDLTLQIPPSIGYGTLSSPAWRRAYIKAALDVVRVTQPRYLSLGNEVNRWYEKYGLDGDNGFRNYVTLYNAAYDAVKELSPDTQVFCTFSREIVSENREADLGVLDLFDPERMDLLALTSYPNALGIGSPSELPDDYYTMVLDHMPGKSLSFTELGWPSAEVFGGELAQALFLTEATGRLSRERGVDLGVVGWCRLHDLNSEDSTGLITLSGRKKEAYSVWVNLGD